MAYEGQLGLFVERQFEVYEIHWSVRDLSLLTCGVDWSLQSPEFAVRGCQVDEVDEVTKWTISLRPASDELQPDSVVLALKRCEADGGPEWVSVQWKTTIRVSSQKSQEIAQERLCDFKAGSEYPENLETLKSSIEAIRSFDSDHMTIRCKMIVYKNEEEEEVLELCKDQAKVKLSEDLSNLFLGGADCDLRLKIGGKSISAHKAVACARIPLLNHLLESSEGDGEVDVVDVSYLNYDATLKIMEYAYSGDLALILEEPSLAMFESVHSLDMYHLKNIYNAKELYFRTLLAAQETRFTWTIANFFEESGNSLTSPQFTDELSGDWNLHIFEGENAYSDYFSVSAEHSGGELEGHFCVEFSVADEHGRSVFSKLLRRRAEDGLGRLRVDKFIRRSTLRTLLIGRDLRLTLKIKLSDGLQPTSFVEGLKISAVSNCYITSLNLLSLEMLESLNMSDFSDVRLQCQGQSFGVHRCIVGARCGFLLNLINNDEKDENGCVIVKDIEFDVLWLLMNYIYGGELPEHEERDKVPKLRDAAVRFRLPVLEEICEEMLARVAGFILL